MGNERHDRWSRRQFLSAAAWAGTGAAFGLRSESVAAEPPPETTRIRLPQSPAICIAPLYLVDELLRADGVTEVEHVRMDANLFTPSVASGKVDLALNFSGPLVMSIDEGAPVMILAGIHAGCF